MTRVVTFDSGVGGLSVVDAIVMRGAPVTIVHAADLAWLPYGNKPEDALRARVTELIVQLAAREKADAVVIACNTASTMALDAVRAALSIPVVGVVPPIKPAAAMTRSGVIGLLATPATVRRPYVDDLIARFASGITVRRHGDLGLVAAAEALLRGGTIDRHAVSEAVTALFAGAEGQRIDVVALACTHFPLLRRALQAAGPPDVLWIDSGDAVARRLVSVLGLEERAGGATFEAFLSTADPDIGGTLRPPFMWWGTPRLERI